MSKARPLLPAFLLCIAALCGLFACKPAKNTAYFQTIPKDTVLRNTVTRNFDLAIKPGDILSITIASASPELSASFNTAPGGEGGIIGGYLVGKEGTIEIYKLGAIKVSGLTRVALQEKLRQDLAPYLKDPLVTVRFANHRATVLGAVGNPGVIPLTADGVTVLEAIGQSGDLAQNSKREKVLVIRQTAEGKEFHHLNLLDHSVFTSPYFYLQNEDVVYVEPEPEKEKAGLTQVFSYIISGISIISLLISRIR
jgi:polysaccharide export outer membrane protein